MSLELTLLLLRAHMQLLIDFKYVAQPGGMHVDFKTGQVSYT